MTMIRTAIQKLNLRMTSRFQLAMALLGLMVFLAGAGTGFCDEVQFTEYQVKALFLMNFTKYVDWPADAFAGTNTPMVIGVYGDNLFGEDLPKTVAGRKVANRDIVIRQIESTNDLAQCQIVFISNSEKKHLGEILDKLKALPVLTVGESEQFTKLGGMINFVKKDGTIHFEVNLAAAHLAQLRISSKLLTVADKVGGKQ